MYCSLFTQTSLPTVALSFPSHKTRPICLRRRYRGNPRMSMDQKKSPNPNFITTVSKLLWGKALPPSLLISTVRTAWSTTWHLMMSQLAPSDPSGSYTRPTSQFRVQPLNSTLKPGSLHLYVGIPCPWAHRTLIVRALKGLEDAVSVSVASPGIDGSWVFEPDSDDVRVTTDRIVPTLDKVNGCRTMREVYNLRRGGYNGRSTVPMLWDVEKRDVLCNESYDVIELLNSGLNELAGNPDTDLSPPALKKEIHEWNQLIYPNINNGVYRCGFAQSQEAYDSAVNGLFKTLDMVDDHLGKSRYLCGDALTLADVCLFTTLIRFDLVYNVMFKCTKKKIIEYPNLHPYMRDIYQIPNVAATCNFEATMDGYYKFLFPLNPGGIRPIMPSGSEHEVLSKPHNRGGGGSVSTFEERVNVIVRS
ncbi:glutathionyl-hydroquinone reductase PcpF [Impatiens glandulifera]|uniref:glutathionyl-hydroquinone reductase PcpF n=1 Tax=Impatiens glandulifera TaxID=253017 RepID=UPI001FB0E27D|nr:glutathionyl-hydroquinone reductase PcpF [Impatiens glandulifera]